MTYCEDCGCKVFNGRCVNCHEELYIQDQYFELGMQLPPHNSGFMKKVFKQEKEIAKKKSLVK